MRHAVKALSRCDAPCVETWQAQTKHIFTLATAVELHTRDRWFIKKIILPLPQTEEMLRLRKQFRLLVSAMIVNIVHALILAFIKGCAGK